MSPEWSERERPNCKRRKLELTEALCARAPRCAPPRARNNRTVYKGAFDYQDVAVKIAQVPKRARNKDWEKQKYLFMREICLCAHRDMRHRHLMVTMGGCIREKPRRELISVMQLCEFAK